MTRPILLVFAFDLLSHHLRCLQLADAVRDLFDVRFVHSERYSRHAEAAGFETFACEIIDADEVMACAERFDFSWINSETIERVYDDQVRVIRELGAGVVLGDTAPTLRMAAETTGVRHLSLMNGYMTRDYALTRPIASSHPAAKYADKLPPAIFDWMTRTGERAAFRQVHRPFRKLRKRVGLPSTGSYLNELEGNLNLICDDPDMFPQAGEADSNIHIGPLYHVTSGAEPEIEAAICNGRPTILATIGSSGDPDRLSFLSAPTFQSCNIVVAGHEIPGLTGPNVVTKAFVNLDALLPGVDLMICHGGNGSILQALSHGIPVVSLTRIFEQEWNARRVDELGLGAWVRPGTPDTVAAAAVSEWLGRKGTGKLAEWADRIDVTRTRRAFREAIRNTYEH